MLSSNIIIVVVQGHSHSNQSYHARPNRCPDGTVSCTSLPTELDDGIYKWAGRHDNHLRNLSKPSCTVFAILLKQRKNRWRKQRENKNLYNVSAPIENRKNDSRGGKEHFRHVIFKIFGQFWQDAWCCAPCWIFYTFHTKNYEQDLYQHNSFPSQILSEENKGLYVFFFFFLLKNLTVQQAHR